MVHTADMRGDSFRSIVHETDWSRLCHAYGRATDTPRHLAALVANERLSDPQHGNAHRWFKNLGLTYDRDACRALLRERA